MTWKTKQAMGAGWLVGVFASLLMGLTAFLYGGSVENATETADTVSFVCAEMPSSPAPNYNSTPYLQRETNAIAPGVCPENDGQCHPERRAILHCGREIGCTPNFTSADHGVVNCNASCCTKDFFCENFINGRRWNGGSADGNGSSFRGNAHSPVKFRFTNYWHAIGLGDLIAAAGIFILIILGHVFLLRHFFKALEVRFQQYSPHLLHALWCPVSCLVALCGGVGMAQFLVISNDTLVTVNRLFRSGTLFLGAWILICLNDALFDRLSHRISYQKSDFFGVLPLLKRTCRIGIGIIGILLLVDGLGYSVNGIFATLGIGGALIALAAKDSVANIFGSLSIILDRPFKVGDWIKVGDGTIEGDVEQIGLRSTRIRTHAKTLMTVPNSILTNDVIDNWSRMYRRRVRQNIYVAPTAQAEELQRFTEDVETILRNDEGVYPEPRFCAICEFEPASIQILVYYFTLSVDLEPHMRVRNRINGQILALARRLGLSLSTPFELRNFSVQRADIHDVVLPQVEPNVDSLEER